MLNTGLAPQAFDLRSEWYVSAMERLIQVVQDLSHAHELEDIMRIVRTAARELTGADGASFVLRENDHCYYADEDAISPLWKGQRFPLKMCISGWVMMNSSPVIIEDIFQDPRIPADVYRPTFVKSMAMVPIRRDIAVGAIGNYWANMRRPTEEEIQILQSLAHVTSVAMENVDLYSQLQSKIHALETSNEELAKFAWAASHDLKSPLRAVDHLSVWIEEELGEKLEGKPREYMNKLRGRVARMEKLLDDILKYSRLEGNADAGGDEIADGKTLLEDLNMLVNLPAQFELQVDEAFLNVRGKRLPLQRVLCNLVDNAVKHHDREDGKINIGVQEEMSRYVFTIRDDGPGIAPEFQRRVFEMFQTLKPRDTKEGSGMGLSMVKKILAVNGGTITLDSQPGNGCGFIFTWPKL